MTAEEYLQVLIAKNPALGKPDDKKITLTCRGLRNIIKQAHEIGCKHGEELQKKFDTLFGIRKGNPFF